MTPTPAQPAAGHDAAAADAKLLDRLIAYHRDTAAYEAYRIETVEALLAYLASREAETAWTERCDRLSEEIEALRNDVANTERDRDALREALGTSWCKMGDMQVVNCIHNGCYQAACPFKEALARSAKPCCVVCDTDAACEYPGGRPKHCPRNIGAEP